MALDLTRQIEALKVLPLGQYVADALLAVQEGVNSLGQNLAGEANNTIAAPPAIQQLNVKSNGTGLIHATIDDHNPIQKNLHYFVEYDTNPNFTQPQVKHLGPSRTMEPMTLPAMDDGHNPQNFYFRAFAQYPGGHPGPVINFGGQTPSPVAPGGTQALTLLPSTGSGTAQASGQEGGSGFGKVLNRPATGPKRTA